jgi:hypothetical protein
MQYTVELLITGDQKIGEYYRLAVERWKEIWLREESKDILPLAVMLSDEEFWFEQNCGGRGVSQEIMVLSGIGMLYSTRTGFGDNRQQAQRLHSAFQRSFCSIEVKFRIQEAAKFYKLLDEPAGYGAITVVEPIHGSETTRT